MTDDRVVCPSCGARNAATADWCSQCFDPLGGRGGEGSDELDEVAAGPAATSAADAPARTGIPASAPDGDESDVDGGELRAGEGRFRRTDEGIDWRCLVCETWNPVERLTCTVCGSAMDATPGSTTGLPAGVEPRDVRVASWLAPGGGQWVLGQRGKAVGRIIIAVLWLVGGAALVAAGSGTSGGVLPGAVLLLGVVAVWGLSIVDAHTAAAGGRRELLDGRVFLWLVVGVIGTVLVTLVVRTLALGGG